jgi:hypothetical protein
VISRRHLLSAGSAALLLSACTTPPAGPPPEDGTIDMLTLLRSKPEHRRFMEALNRSGLAQRIGQANGPVTVFAPLDSGWEAVPADLQALLDRPADQLDAAARTRLASAVGSNIAWGHLRLEDFPPRFNTVTTWDGGRVRVAQTGPRVASLRREPPGTAPVTAAAAGSAAASSAPGRSSAITRGDVLASDGVIHVTSTPLF